MKVKSANIIAEVTSFTEYLLSTYHVLTLFQALRLH